MIRWVFCLVLMASAGVASGWVIGRDSDYQLVLDLAGRENYARWLLSEYVPQGERALEVCSSMRRALADVRGLPALMAELHGPGGR